VQEHLLAAHEPKQRKAMLVLSELSVGVRNSEKIALCDPVMPVADGFRG
jgi:hypothetical protein